MKVKKEIISILLAFALFFALTFSAAGLLIPYRHEYGTDWKDYLNEEEGSCDVLFFGSSIVYCDVIPSVIYEETGISSYVTAGPEQTIPLSYYYIKEALKTQSPQAVVLELTGMFFNKYEGFTQANIAYMPYGVNRLEATFNAAETERRAGLLFPILDYHDRWLTVSGQELCDNLFSADDLKAGYTFLKDAVPCNEISYRSCAGEDAYAVALEYLKKISEFCSERDVKLILYIAPEMLRIPEEDVRRLERDLQGADCTVYTDFNCENDFGIDNETDWYDPLHFNYRGAIKFSARFAELLTEAGISPSGNSSEELWAQRSAYLDELIKSQ